MDNQLIEQKLEDCWIFDEFFYFVAIIYFKMEFDEFV
jgi:hypothetical protein